MRKTARTQSKFTIRRRVVVANDDASDREAAELLIARLVARAYAHDHPELFQPAQPRVQSQASAGDPRPDDGGPGPDTRIPHG